MKYIHVILLSIALLSCEDTVQEEQFAEATYRPVTTSQNTCDLILWVDSLGITSYGTVPINPPDSLYRNLVVEIQYKLLTDTFDCHISGPIVGTDEDRYKSYQYIEITKFKE